MVVPWLCHGRAMVVSWLCHGRHARGRTPALNKVPQCNVRMNTAHPPSLKTISRHTTTVVIREMDKEMDYGSESEAQRRFKYCPRRLVRALRDVVAVRVRSRRRRRSSTSSLSGVVPALWRHVFPVLWRRVAPCIRCC